MRALAILLALLPLTAFAEQEDMHSVAQVIQIAQANENIPGCHLYGLNDLA